MAVFEVRIPTGYVALNNELRDYVRSGTVPDLMYARYHPHFVRFFFKKVSSSPPTSLPPFPHSLTTMPTAPPGMHGASFDWAPAHVPQIDNARAKRF